MMRRVAMGVLAMVTACVSEEILPQLPPPPVDAAASCVVKLAGGTPDVRPVTNMLWLDAGGRVIRLDGWDPDYQLQRYVPAPEYFAYDDQGRLIEQRDNASETHYEYAPQQIIVTSSAGDDSSYTLVDGRAVHLEGPLYLAPESRSKVDFTYDEQGRLTSIFQVGDHAGTQYTYDAQGRVTAMQQTRNGIVENAYTLSYTETPLQLIVKFQWTSALSAPRQRWTYDFDANHRIIRSAVDNNDDGFDDVIDRYRYFDGEIDVDSNGRAHTATRAIGACDPPAVVVAPEPPVPLHWTTFKELVPNAAVEKFQDPFF